MSESTSEEMEGRATSQKVVLSQNGKEPVPKGKGQWRGQDRRGQTYGRSPNVEYHRQWSGDRRDAYNQPQRRGTMPDKRPQSRGVYEGSRDLRKLQDSGDLLDGPLTGSSAGSKKYGLSLNHLLNFKYVPRENTPRRYQSRTSRKSSTPFNKEQFIQANFQFVVCDSGEYTVHVMDPDVLVDWNLIEQVRIYSHEMPSCPICLYPPVAAKITRCGHIYCWSCMLHYLSLTDKSWHKCPICQEAVHKKDLKSVTALKFHPFAVGQTISMRLMKRAKNSVITIPKEQWKERELKPFGVNDKEETRYAKLLLASPEEVLEQIVVPEEVALDTQLMEANSEPSEEVCFIEAAIHEIKTRRESLSNTKDSVEEIRNLLENVLEHQEGDGKKGCEITGWKVLSSDAIQGFGEYEAAFSDDDDDGDDEEEAKQGTGTASNFVPAESEEASSVEETKDRAESAHGSSTKSSLEGTSESTSGDSSSESPTPLSPVSVPAQFYYFYQADDGQNIFLSPINARCLVKEYGSLENCPEFITGKIVEMESMSQSEDLRKHYRYLSHLPLSCEFVICELDLKPPFVSRTTLDFYREELKQRRQQRQKKLRMEKRRDQKMSSSGNFSTSSQSACRRFVPEALDLTSEVEFPAQAGGVGGGSGQLALSPPSNFTPSPFMQFAAVIANQGEGYGTVAEGDGSTQCDSLGVSPPSFAQALRSNKGIDIPKRVERPRETGQLHKRTASEEEDHDEDCVPVPSFQSAFSDALFAADWTGRGLLSEGPAVERSGGKKQKKGKKKLLFTTGSFMKYS